MSLYAPGFCNVTPALRFFTALPNGALIADDKQTSPIAIVDGDKTWCMDDDADYVFAIQIDGVGKGNYVFGVWAKPKGK